MRIMKTNYLYSLCKDALHVFLTKCILSMMLGNFVFSPENSYFLCTKANKYF